MSRNTVVSLETHRKVHDPVTELMREGTRQLLAHALEVEDETDSAVYVSGQKQGVPDCIRRYSIG